MKNYMNSEGLKIKRKKLSDNKKQREKIIKPHKDSKNSKPTFGKALARAAMKKFLMLDIEDWK
jgi:hypothetical protein